MWFDARVRPWYGWRRFETETRVNIGICYHPDDTEDPKKIFAEVVERNVGKRWAGATQVGKFRRRPHRLHAHRRARGQPRRAVGRRVGAPDQRLVSFRRGHLPTAMRSASRRQEGPLTRLIRGRWPALYADLHPEQTTRAFNVPLHSALSAS